MLLVALACIHPVQHRTPQVQVRTLADAEWLAVAFELDPGWHVYWVNPGDAGMATDIRSDDVRVGAPRFPAPERFVAPGPIESFGYSDELVVLLPFERIDESVVELDAAWLVCKEECVYQEALLRVDPADRTRLDRYVDALPYEAQLEVWTGDGWLVPPGELFPSAELASSGARITERPDGIHISSEAAGHWAVHTTNGQSTTLTLESP